jgi:hypothetical protein
MSAKIQSKRATESDEDSRIKQLIKERSELNEGLNSLLKKITKTSKGKKTHNL